ncbi:MAG: hypothetical protein M5R36_08610 [Deltaproteobacteria bacterium]|nr:hypothetical protein [Deltaproteobacteria bacterium]
MSGQTLPGALAQAGVADEDAMEVVDALRDVEFPFRRMRPGQTVVAYLDDGALGGLDFHVDRLVHYEVRPEGDGFAARREEIPTTTEVRDMGARVATSVYEAILDAGEGDGLASLVSGLFAWDIDFYTDPRVDDSFRLIYERELLPDGTPHGYGRLLAGEYDGEKTGRRRGFWFSVGDEDIDGFYDEKGVQLRRTFMRAPLDTMRITSRFGMRRHPILKRRAMHHGVDFGAPTGTPVWAVADGKVISAGRRGAAGNPHRDPARRRYRDAVHASVADCGSFGATRAPGADDRARGIDRPFDRPAPGLPRQTQRAVHQSPRPENVFRTREDPARRLPRRLRSAHERNGPEARRDPAPGESIRQIGTSRRGLTPERLQSVGRLTAFSSQSRPSTPYRVRGGKNRNFFPAKDWVIFIGCHASGLSRYTSWRATPFAICRRRCAKTASTWTRFSSNISRTTPTSRRRKSKSAH